MVEQAAVAARHWWELPPVWVSATVSLAAAFGGGLLGSLLAKRQKYWDLRRDTALEVMEVFGELHQLLNNMFHISWTLKSCAEGTNRKLWDETLKDYEHTKDEYVVALRRFWGTQGKVELVFPKNVADHMSTVHSSMSSLVSLLKEKEVSDEVEDERKARRLKFDADKKLVLAAMKRNLKI
jgi:hypothetical protein